jgi:hypothetical protein
MPSDTDTPSGRPFDREAAFVALEAAANTARTCQQAGGPSGSARVEVVFAPSGEVTDVSVDPPFADTPVGGCIMSAFALARVPPFDGEAVKLEKSVEIA